MQSDQNSQHAEESLTAVDDVRRVREAIAAQHKGNFREHMEETNRIFEELRGKLHLKGPSAEKMTANNPQSFGSELKNKRAQWLDVLNGSDQHSLTSQLSQMSWDAACFWSIAEATESTPLIDDTNPELGVQLSGMLHNSLRRWYFACQMSAIRRFSDGSDRLEGKRGIYSVQSLIDDLDNSRELFTREAIFEAEGLEYDYLAIQRRREKWQSQFPKSSVMRALPTEFNDGPSHLRHIWIDALAGIKSSRQPTDRIPPAVFTNLKTKIKSACDDVDEYVNKFIAHAASPESRAVAKMEELNLTWNHLRSSHQAFCQVINFLSVYILGGPTITPMPVPQFNPFEYLDRPLIETDKVPALKRRWHELTQEFNSCTKWGPTEYDLEFGTR